MALLSAQKKGKSWFNDHGKEKDGNLGIQTSEERKVDGRR